VQRIHTAATRYGLKKHPNESNVTKQRELVTDVLHLYRQTRYGPVTSNPITVSLQLHGKHRKRGKGFRSLERLLSRWTVPRAGLDCQVWCFLLGPEWRVLSWDLNSSSTTQFILGLGAGYLHPGVVLVAVVSEHIASPSRRH